MTVGLSGVKRRFGLFVLGQKKFLLHRGMPTAGRTVRGAEGRGRWAGQRVGKLRQGLRPGYRWRGQIWKDASLSQEKRGGCGEAVENSQE